MPVNHVDAQTITFVMPAQYDSSRPGQLASLADKVVFNFITRGGAPADFVSNGRVDFTYLAFIGD